MADGPRLVYERPMRNKRMVWPAAIWVLTLGVAFTAAGKGTKATAPLEVTYYYLPG